MQSKEFFRNSMDTDWWYLSMPTDFPQWSWKIFVACCLNSLLNNKNMIGSNEFSFELRKIMNEIYSLKPLYQFHNGCFITWIFFQFPFYTRKDRQLHYNLKNGRNELNLISFVNSFVKFKILIFPVYFKQEIKVYLCIISQQSNLYNYIGLAIKNSRFWKYIYITSWLYYYNVLIYFYNR